NTEKAFLEQQICLLQQQREERTSFLEETISCLQTDKQSLLDRVVCFLFFLCLCNNRPMQAAELQSRQDSLAHLQEETKRLHTQLQQMELDKDSQLRSLREELLSQTQQLDSCQARPEPEAEGKEKSLESRAEKQERFISDPPPAAAPSPPTSNTTVTNTSDLNDSREINFEYLKHVVLKFMSSREAELIRAVSVLLNFTREEEDMLKQTLEYKAKIKARDLRGKKKEELLKQLDDLKNELSQLRVAKVTGGAASKLSKIMGAMLVATSWGEHPNRQDTMNCIKLMYSPSRCNCNPLNPIDEDQGESQLVTEAALRDLLVAALIPAYILGVPKGVLSLLQWLNVPAFNPAESRDCWWVVEINLVKENLRKFYKGKKYKPLDLRPKKTRALRRQLNKHEESFHILSVWFSTPSTFPLLPSSPADTPGCFKDNSCKCIMKDGSGVIKLKAMGHTEGFLLCLRAVPVDNATVDTEILFSFSPCQHFSQPEDLPRVD
ncbi:hypothetical protein XENOCAPTIV_001724, partial [Xenoophorus captivus]